MADNVAVTAGTGTTVAADEVVDGTLGTVKVQYVKLMDGTLDGTTKAAVGARGVAVDIAAAAAAIAKAEDVASADADVGVPAMAVRKATPANTSGTDGDYEMLQMSAGRLWTSSDLTLAGTAVTAGSGAIAAGTPRVALATDSPGVLANRTTAGTMSNGFVQVGLPTDQALPAGETHLGEVGGKSAVFSVALSTDTSAYASGDLIADTQQMDAFFRKADGTGVINSISIVDQDAQGVALYVIFMSTSTSLGTENSAPNISDANLAAGFQGIVAVATTDYVTVSGAKVATIKNIGLPVKAVSGTDDLYIAVLNATGTPTFTATGLNMRIQALLD